MDTRERERTGQNINVWLPDDLMNAFEALRARTRLNRKTQLEVILEKHLAENGLWPPAETEG